MNDILITSDNLKVIMKENNKKIIQDYVLAQITAEEIAEITYALSNGIELNL